MNSMHSGRGGRSDSLEVENGSFRYFGQGKNDSLDLPAIEAALTEAAKRANITWITFLTLLTYLFIAIGSITHRHLFLESPIKLPLFNIDLPLATFFIAAPVLFSTLHFYVLVQLHALRATIATYNEILLRLVPVMADRRRLQQRLDNSAFVHVLSRRWASHRLPRLMYTTIVVLTTAVLPLLLTISFQIVFLPYHSTIVTNFHRAMVLFEILLVGTFLLLLKPRGSTSGRFFKWNWLPGFGATLVRGTCLAAAFAFSWAIATFPGESIYEALKESWVHRQLTTPLFEGNTDFVKYRATSPFSNRLVLPNQELIEPERLDRTRISISLRGRDFRKAIFDRSDLRKADFTGANLTESTFIGANLEEARFGCADTGVSDPADPLKDFREASRKMRRYSSEEESSGDGCTHLDHVVLSGARLKAAQLGGVTGVNLFVEKADLTDAKFRRAHLPGAFIWLSRMNGAVFDDADLTGAHISNSTGYGASFVDAKMRLTYFGLVSFDGASMQEADMFGAQFLGGSLNGVTFNGANLLGAEFYGTSLKGASFLYTDLRGASLSGSKLEGALFACDRVYRTEASFPIPASAIVIQPDSSFGKTIRLAPYSRSLAREFARLAARRESCPSDAAAAGRDELGETAASSYAEIEAATTREMSYYETVLLRLEYAMPTKERSNVGTTGPPRGGNEKGERSWAWVLARLVPGAQSADDDARDASMWLSAERNSIPKEEYQARLAEIFSAMVCEDEEGGLVALALIRSGRLGDAGNRLASLVERWRAAIQTVDPDCRGIHGLSVADLDGSDIRKLNTQRNRD